MENLRYGIIGSGMMGVEHIQNIAHVDGAEVVALADPHPPSLENAQAVMAEGGQGDPVPTYADYRELVADNICDVLVIASPNMTHIDVLRNVLGTEHHLLIEKPLCTTVADCEEVVAASADHPGLIWMGLEYRYMPPVSRLISEVRNGAVGNVHMVSMREHRFPFLQKVGDWNRFNRNSGGTLVEKCCHYFDLMTQIIGKKPVRVFASGGQNVNHLDEMYDGERPDILDNAFVIVDYPNGKRAMLDLCMFAEATKNQEELVVIGDAGKLESLLPENVLLRGRRGEHWIGGVETVAVADEAIRFSGFHHGSSYLEHVDLVACVRSGTPPLVTLDDGLWSVAVGAAAHRSIEENRSVDLTEMFTLG